MSPFSQILIQTILYKLIAIFSFYLLFFCCWCFAFDASFSSILNMFWSLLLMRRFLWYWFEIFDKYILVDLPPRVDRQLLEEGLSFNWPFRFFYKETKIMVPGHLGLSWLWSDSCDSLYEGRTYLCCSLEWPDLILVVHCVYPDQTFHHFNESHILVWNVSRKNCKLFISLCFPINRKGFFLTIKMINSLTNKSWFIIEFFIIN